MYYYFIDTKDGALVFQREATEKEFEKLKKISTKFQICKEIIIE